MSGPSRLPDRPPTTRISRASQNPGTPKKKTIDRSRIYCFFFWVLVFRDPCFFWKTNPHTRVCSPTGLFLRTDRPCFVKFFAAALLRHLLCFITTTTCLFEKSREDWIQDTAHDQARRALRTLRSSHDSCRGQRVGIRLFRRDVRECGDVQRVQGREMALSREA